jgi:hypothetical protein
MQDAREFAHAIVVDLNKRERDDIELAESSRNHPGEKPSGAPNARIAEHQRKLQMLGYEAGWNQETRIVVFALLDE